MDRRKLMLVALTIFIIMLNIIASFRWNYNNWNYNSNEGDMRYKTDRWTNKIAGFLTDSDKGAFVIEVLALNQSIAMIMYSITNRDSVYPWKTIYDELDRSLFQIDGRFFAIFQLRVHPSYRRLGLANKLKLMLEEEAQKNKVNLIYTHTEETNNHVIELNKKNGYQEVQRGPIWDEVIRVSLIKQLS